MRVLDFSEIEKYPFTKIVISDHCPLHSHTFFEFSVCFEGDYLNNINGTTLKICKGNVILLRPQDEHYFIHGKNHLHRDVYILPEKMKAICDAISKDLFDTILEKPLVINFLMPANKLSALEIDLNFFNNLAGKSRLLLETKYVKTITDLLFCWQNNCQNINNNYPEWLHTLLNNLNSNQFVCKNISEIIKSTNYSHGHVCREFKKYLKVPLQHYISDLKFAYACALLLDKTNKMVSIATKLNYGSASNFLIAFKNRFGLTPSEWRKKNT